MNTTTGVTASVSHGEPDQRPVSAILTVARREWRDLVRDTRLRLLAAVSLLLLLSALLFGITQAQRIEREQAAAANIDRSLWEGQGAKNPHSAAHFGQYAFKPVGVLALADPGVDAYVGSAVWLEAHKQNESQFRPARDAGLKATAGGSGGLSLAFVLQTVAPLLACLLGFSAFTGERERGTLRQLLALGVRPRHLLAGKALAIGGALLLLLLPAWVGVFGGIFMLDHGHEVATHDRWQGVMRLLALSAVYALYLGGFIALALAVSAWAKNSRTALVVLLAFWLANCFLAPRLGSDWVRAAEPLPSAQAFRDAIAADKKQLFGHDEKHPAFAAFKARVLAEYGVTRVEDLPVSFRGLSLREDDRAGYTIYDQRYTSLQAAIDRQDARRALPGFLLPLLAVQPSSMALAGTDSRHHHHFTTRAEMHRRMIQEVVSDDLIRNANNGDPDYRAPPALFASIPSFVYTAPAASDVVAGEIRNIAALLIWLFSCSGFALWAATRLRPV